MSYNKYVKYKILKMKINQQLTNDEMILEKLPSGDTIVKQPRLRGMPKWFKEWSDNIYQNQPPKWFHAWSKDQFEPLVRSQQEQQKFNVEIRERLEKLEKAVFK